MNRYTTRPDLLKMIQKYHQGTATEAEKAFVEEYYAFSGARYVEGEQLDAADKESIQQEMEASLLDYINTPKEEQVKRHVIKLWPRIAAVAAAVALIVLGVYFFNHPAVILNSVQDPALAMNDIAPGKNGATITLASGKVIQLSDKKSGVVIEEDKLAYNDGSSVGRHPEFSSGSRTREATITASTTKGQTYIFTLPDGTKVWLNAASTLTIPSDFSGTETRKVELNGEAYFEVAKNKKRPFIVESDGQEVTVLGTHFNINAYNDEGSVRTTLLEGSVRVATLSAFGGEMPNGQRGGKTPNSSLPTRGISPQGGESSIVLKPNQQSIITDNNRIVVKEVEVNEAIAWKNGKFVFNDEPLENIMRKVSRWYDVDIEYRGIDPKKPFWGSISCFENVSKVLEKLELTGGVDFKIDGKKIIVSRGK